MIRVKRECKNPKYVVIVNCQGNPFYYLYRTMIGAFIGYASRYKKLHKYNTSNIELKEWTVVAFWNKELRNHISGKEQA